MTTGDFVYDDDDLDHPDEDAAPTEPEEGDWTTMDHINFFSDGHLMLQAHMPGDRHTPLCDHCMWDAIDAVMDLEKFWPNVWFISDHGNAHLMKKDG
jgi:hypothetical protein